MPSRKPRKIAKRPRHIRPVEAPPPEIEKEEQQPQVVEVKHKTEWSELRPVDEAPAEQDTLFEDEEITEAKPRRKFSSERDELKKKLAKAAITPGSQLKLTIEKYLHSDAVDGQGGMFAETEHCTKYVCAEAHITSEDYLDVARRFGPGLYRFTLRLKNLIVTAWDKRISAGTISPIIGHANPADPNSPQVIVNMPEGAQQPVGIIDPMRQMRELAKTYKEMKSAFEPEGMQAAPAAAAPTDPKIAALQLIADNPDVMERIGKGIASTVLGARSGDSDPWADVAMEAIKTGQAAEIAATIIREIMSPFRSLGGNNGQAPMAAPPPAPVPHPQNGRPPMRPIPHAERPADSQVQEGMGQVQGAPQPQVMLTPADALMLALIDAMARNAPLKEAQNIINVAIYRNPELDESIDELLNHSVDEILDMLTTFHPQVAKIEHAKAWLETLVGSYATEAQTQEAAE